MYNMFTLTGPYAHLFFFFAPWQFSLHRYPSSVYVNCARGLSFRNYVRNSRSQSPRSRAVAPLHHRIDTCLHVLARFGRRTVYKPQRPLFTGGSRVIRTELRQAVSVDPACPTCKHEHECPLPQLVKFARPEFVSVHVG